MRRLIGVVAIVAIVVVAVGSQIGCSKKAEARGVNLVEGIAPASDAFGGIHGFTEELLRLPAAERAAHIERERPRLNQGVVYFLRGLGRIKPNEEVEKVEIFFGSIEGTRAHDGAGKEYKGYFKDELIARVSLKGGRTEDALVRCLNLYMELPEHIKNLQPLSSTPMVVEMKEFTIEPRQGLVRYVDYAVAIDLAEKHKLPLYRGRRQTKGNLIAPDKARELESRTDWEQVTVGVVTGDHFDLRSGKFDKSPRRRRG